MHLQNDIIKRYKTYLRLEKALSDNSIDAYLTDIDKLTNFAESEGKHYRDVTYADLQQFVAGLRDIGIHPRSQKRIISGIKSFYRFLFIDGFISADPTELLESPKIGLKLPTVLTVNATLPQLEAHTGACLRIGVTPLEVREAIYQCAPFIGFPKVLNAVAAANRAFEKAGVSLPLPDAGCVPDERRYEAGLALQKPLYGDEIKDRYTWLPGEFADAVPRFLTEFGFGDLATRTVLSEKERELLTVVMLAALGGAETQVKAHIGGAMRAGSTAEEVVCALVHAMPYMGIPRLFNALNCAKDELSAK